MAVPARSRAPVAARFAVWSLAALALLPGACAAACSHPPQALGLQFGEPAPERVLVWSRTHCPARLVVQYASRADFSDARSLRGPVVVAESDFTVRRTLDGLRAGRDWFIRVWFESLDPEPRRGAPLTGRVHTIGPGESIRFVWSGDTAGQGWGINTAVGGMKIYETMRRRQPQFFIHSGDTIYADAPIAATQAAEDGQVWTNLVTPEVAKVAETLAEFRGRYRYNQLDANVQRFSAEVPQVWQWDDHEVVNNWSAAKDLTTDPRYRIKDVALLRARATQAFREYAPFDAGPPSQPMRLYRRLDFGPLLEVFVLDLRSHRGPNGCNRERRQSAATALLGEAQLDWLARGLRTSRALWKIIAADQPIGLNIADGTDGRGCTRFEGIANADDGPAAGRELEIARLLRAMRDGQVRNVVWLTADVHYTAAHFYDPARARTPDFSPFWEFVSGPLNAGSFGPATPDATFGPQVVFTKAPPPGRANLSPLAGLQFFGEVNIDIHRRTLTVDLRDSAGASLYRQTLVPVGTAAGAVRGLGPAGADLPFGLL